MNSQFDSVPNRKNTGSYKWDSDDNPSTHSALIPMWIADMDFPAAPEIEEALVRRVRHGVFGYSMIPDDLRRAILSWTAERHDFRVSDAHLVVTPGVMPTIAVLIDVLTDVGAEVVIQPPVYYPFRHVVRENGRRIVNNPLVRSNGRYEMDLDHLRGLFENGARIMILCSPHNPVGRVWTGTELSSLVDLCDRYGVTLISDEIHCDIVTGHRPHVPLLRETDYRGAVLLASPSKTFNLAGLPLGYALVPDADMRSRLEHELRARHATLPNVLAVTAALAAYRHCGGWVDAMVSYVRGNDEFLRTRISRFSVPLSAPPLEGTYLEWLDFSALEMEQSELAELMLSGAGVRMNDGPMFGPGGRGFQRMNIATSRETLTKALDRIEKALTDHGRRRGMP